MGRGNACVHGEYEGLYYIDWDNFTSNYADDNGNVSELDYQLASEDWEESLEQFVEDFTKRFKSFSKCGKGIWTRRDERAVMENSLFYIVVEDNEWSMAIKLIQKEQSYYKGGNIENFQKGKYQIYLEGMKECLFLQFEELGTYGGAWTSGRIKRTA